MTRVVAPRPRVLRGGRPDAAPCLLSIGTAVPELELTQDELAGRLARAWRLDRAQRGRWRRIVEGSRIERRFGAVEPEAAMNLSTQQRMAAYERLAPPLARRAAARAIAGAGVAAGRVTDLVVVTCTGFSAPGLDVALVETLGLSRRVRRTIVGFMGCFGALVGLRTAIGACRAEPGAITLVVCVELCSLHVRAAADPQSLVASALFADGAAAAVVGPRGSAEPGGGAGAVGRLGSGSSLLVPEGREWMSWRITDAGFAMTLDRAVPGAMAAALPEILQGPPAASYAVHPGGAAILRAVDRGLELAGARGIEAAWAVLRDYGNMSSPTVLFVLAEALARGHGLPAHLLAFGPGLTIERVVVG